MRAIKPTKIIALLMLFTISAKADNEIIGPDMGWDDEEPIPGDVNNDSKVTLLDLVILINYLNNPTQTGVAENMKAVNTDVDGDHATTLKDVEELRNIILGKQVSKTQLSK